MSGSGLRPFLALCSIPYVSVHPLFGGEMQRKSNKFDDAKEFQKARKEMAALRREIILLMRQIRAICEELNLPSPRLQ